MLCIRLMRQSNTHGLQRGNSPVNNRGYLDSRTKGHTEKWRHPPYHYDHQNQPRTQEMQYPTSATHYAHRFIILAQHVRDAEFSTLTCVALSM